MSSLRAKITIPPLDPCLDRAKFDKIRIGIRLNLKTMSQFVGTIKVVSL